MKLFLLSQFFLLSGCYCFEKANVTSSVKDLETTEKSFSLCHLCQLGGRGKSSQMNLYYGFPQTDSKEERYNLPPTEGMADLSTTGVFGGRFEYYVSPGKFFPFRIIGLGLDYSILRNQFRFSDFSNSEPVNYTFTNQRVMGSMNVITLVRPRILGYTTFQAGVLFKNSAVSGELPALGSNLTNSFTYRVGYGVQYYFAYALAVHVEAGYGGGTYIRTGLTFWPF